MKYKRFNYESQKCSIGYQLCLQIPFKRAFSGVSPPNKYVLPGPAKKDLAMSDSDIYFNRATLNLENRIDNFEKV